MRTPYLMNLFQVIDLAIKTKWLRVRMVGWVTEYAYDLRAMNNLSCGDDPNYHPTIRYAIMYTYELNFGTQTVPPFSVKSNSYI